MESISDKQVQHGTLNSAPLRPTEGRRAVWTGSHFNGVLILPCDWDSHRLGGLPHTPERLNATAQISMPSTGSLSQNDFSVALTLKQGFSSQMTVPPRGRVALSANISGCHICGWHRVDTLLQCSQPSTARNYLDQRAILPRLKNSALEDGMKIKVCTVFL